MIYPNFQGSAGSTWGFDIPIIDFSICSPYTYQPTLIATPRPFVDLHKSPQQKKVWRQMITIFYCTPPPPPHFLIQWKTFNMKIENTFP